MTQRPLINLHPNEYSQELHYYPFAVNLDRCAGSCSTLDDLSNRACVSNETEDLNLHVFKMITRINESKTSTKYIHARVNASLMVENVTRIKSAKTMSVGASVKIQKNIVCTKKIIFRILEHVVSKMVNMVEILLAIQ